MQKPFPALTTLCLSSMGETAPIISDSFLSGSAPVTPLPFLRLLHLNHISIPFPKLRKLLLSATNIVRLELRDLPHSAYIPPEAMFTCLATLTNLQALELRIQSPRSHPVQESRRPPPRSHTVLPSLTFLCFMGPSEYLEDLISRIDAPLLDYLSITFFHRLIFDTPQLAQFIGRSRTPKFKALVGANVIFGSSSVCLSLSETFDSTCGLDFTILCAWPDLELSALAQVCTSSFPQLLISSVEKLYIVESSRVELSWQVDNSQWLELLRSFAGVKGFYLCKKFAPRIAPCLQELVGERVTEVLPTLQTLFLEELNLSGPVWESVDQFVAARQLASLPIAVLSWVRNT